MNPETADLSSNPSLFNLLAIKSLVNLLKSAVVIYLDSMYNIFSS